ncbi:MAG: hypothetical protein Q7J57_10880 [Gemmobacter sp.]|nr:hypothetical protein [Gemmobacter sp.]
MDKSQTTKVEPERQGEKPSGPVAGGCGPDPKPIAKAAMLLEVLGVARAKRLAIIIATVEENGIQFVITHDGHRQAIVARTSHAFEHGRVIRVVHR